ncbi:sugar transferase [Pseudactinotalea suaedae]|uniref:sugar transferase n=1 Tax=Pseudactinotalea suaedae TaxID=1524924 RepID=UPI0012E1729F|nr:sugar transferase [Pseudactinotalea suaedae]
MTVTHRVEGRELTYEAEAVLGASRAAAAPARRALAGWRGQRLVYRWAAAALDLLLVTGFTTVVMSGAESSPTSALLPLVIGIVFVLAVGLGHGYDSRRAASGLDELRAIGYGAVALTVSVLAVDFVGLAELRVVPALLGLVATAASVTLVRLAQRSVARSLRARGLFRRRTLVLGGSTELSSVLRDLRDSGRHGLDVVGVCLPADDMSTGDRVGGMRVWGSVKDAAELIADNGIDAVVISSNAMDVDELRRFRWAIEAFETEILVAPNLNEVLSDRVSLRAVSALPLLTVTSGPTRPQLVVKNVMDRTLAFLMLLVAGPIIGVAAVLVRATSPGKAIFRQVRVGVDGRPFTMLKLRSMVADAEVLKADLADEGNKGDGAQFKMVADPRITPVGRVLRRFSIDELPQLWNVLRGDMSLVGPRPPLPSEVATYDAMAVHRLHVKPGVTGLWQVSGRSDLSWEESVRLDLRYVDNFSLLRDLQILSRTVRAVFGARGAY